MARTNTKQEIWNLIGERKKIPESNERKILLINSLIIQLIHKNGFLNRTMKGKPK